jgi:secreted trypsin-like serine protease
MLVILDGQSVAPPVAINRDPSVPAAGDEVIAMGWGLMKRFDNESYSPVLKQASVFVVSNEECEQSTFFFIPMYQGLITSDMLCAGTTGEGPFKGDSGGPLIITSSSGDVLVSVDNWILSQGPSRSLPRCIREYLSMQSRSIPTCAFIRRILRQIFRVTRILLCQ